MLRLALALACLSGCASAPLSAYESQDTYQAACDEYRATGDGSVILVDVGNGETAPIECADYPEVR